MYIDKVGACNIGVKFSFKVVYDFFGATFQHRFTAKNGDAIQCKNQGVWIRWTGTLEWNGGLEWNGTKGLVITHGSERV